MSKERTRVQRELAACERGRGKRYPAGVKAEVVRYARGRRGDGASWASVGDELGLSCETLRRWCVADEGDREGTLARVEVVADRIAGGAVAIVSPSGYRLEGLDAASAVAALKALG